MQFDYIRDSRTDTKPPKPAPPFSIVKSKNHWGGYRASEHYFHSGEKKTQEPEVNN